MPSEKLMLTLTGEFYQDLLTLDSWLEGKARSTHAANLLGKALNQRETQIRERLEYAANKRGITVDELWSGILDGTITEM